jgi:hypothetical protein
VRWQEICRQGGTAKRLQEGVGKLAETLAAGEKSLAVARPRGRRKAQEPPDADNEYRPLRVCYLGGILPSPDMSQRLLPHVTFVLDCHMFGMCDTPPTSHPNNALRFVACTLST